METLSHFVSMAIARAQMERALRESDRRKDEFIATLAHELRNPLAAIRNGFNVLNETGGAAMPRLRPMLDRQLDLLVRLVDDLLEIARIKTGKIELKKQRVDLVNVINQSIEASEPLLRSRAQKCRRAPSVGGSVRGGRPCAFGASVREPNRQRCEIHCPERSDRCERGTGRRGSGRERSRQWRPAFPLISWSRFSICSTRSIVDLKILRADLASA